MKSENFIMKNFELKSVFFSCLKRGSFHEVRTRFAGLLSNVVKVCFFSSPWYDNNRVGMDHTSRGSVFTTRETQSSFTCHICCRRLDTDVIGHAQPKLFLGKLRFRSSLLLLFWD